MEENTVLVDCDAGRRLGCGNLCCQLMVMLSMEDLEHGLEPQSSLSGLLKQDLDGYCHYLDRDSKRCTVWDKRPLACRLYNCNNDPKLQAVMRHGFESFTKCIAQAEKIARTEWIEVPLVDLEKTKPPEDT